MTSKLLEKEIVKWNFNFPLDRWWRKKYGVPFNSKKHQKISQIDILFEYFEENTIRDIGSSDGTSNLFINVKNDKKGIERVIKALNKKLSEVS